MFTATRIVLVSDSDPVINTANASGTDRDGQSVSATDNHSLAVDHHPVLVIDKTGPATAAVGSNVTYSFSVTHDPTSDNSSVGTVSVTDDVAGPATYQSGDGNNNNRLDAGEIWTYSVGYVVTPAAADPLLNTGTVTGTDHDSDIVTAADSHSTDVIHAPVVALVKEGPATAAVGQNVTYTFRVTHDPTSDGSPILNTTITDDIAGPATYLNGDDGDTALELGEEWVYQATYTIQPTDPTPLTNTATANATNRDGGPLTDTATHNTTIDYTPQITITKTGPATANVDDTITYQLDVTHALGSTGSPVSSVSVSDDVAGAATYVSGDTNNDNLLQTTETWRYEADYSVPADAPAALVNIATVDAEDGNGDPVTAQDTHTTTIVFAPVITVVKAGPATGAVGDTLGFTFTLTHGPTSDGSPVSGLSVIDDVAGSAAYQSGDTNADGLLQDDETWLYSRAYVVSVDDPDVLTNTVAVSGSATDGSSVVATDDHDTNLVFAPELQVVKSGPSSATTGQTVTYTYVVSHTSSSDGSPISTVVISDNVTAVPALLSGDLDTDDALDGGETWTYTVDYQVRASDPDPLINTASVSGVDTNGDPILDDDSHSLDIDYLPMLQVAKSGPPNAAVGDTVTYAYEVSHAAGSDGSAITGPSVSDDVTGPASYDSGDSDGDGVLDDGETWIFSDTHTVLASDNDPLVNTATANGSDLDGQTLTATDTHSLAVAFNPIIQIEKTGPATASVGDSITYTFAVRHAPTSDGSPMNTLAVTDDVAGPATLLSGDANSDNLLQLGETWIFTAGHVVSATDPEPLVNIATATANDREGDSLGDTDSHALAIDHSPVVTVDKSGPATASVGDLVNYTFAVGHDVTSDGSPVSGITVDDSIVGPASYDSGDDGDGLLETGETWTFIASYSVTTDGADPLLNTATVEGIDPDGDPLGDTDTHSLDVVYSPVLAVAKSGLAAAAVDQSVTYTFRVTHDATSDGSAVSAVSVLDDVAGAATYVTGDDGDSALELGEEWVYQAARTVLASDPDPLTNTVTVSGTSRDGNPVNATDSHDTSVDYTPTIAIEKSGPASADVGQTITFEFALSHAADSDGSPVSSPAVADDLAGAALYVSGDTNNDGLLQETETWIFAADYVVPPTASSSLVNIATATANDGNGDPVTAQDSHTAVIGFDPVLNTVKSGPTDAAVGEIVAYTFTVSHDATSDGSPVNLLTAVDDVAGLAAYQAGDTDSDGSLDAGEIWTFSRTYLVQADDPNLLSNTVVVTGVDVGGSPITGTDTHVTDIDFEPTMQVSKTGPATASTGDTVTYQYEVSHSVGSDGSPISSITITDDVTNTPSYQSGDTDTDDELDAGEVWVFAVTYVVDAGDPDPLVNTVIVQGADGDNVPFTVTDTHSLSVDYQPVLAVAKTGPASADVGDTVTYTYGVSHDALSDGSPISSIDVDDDITGAAGYTSGDDGDSLLESGETWFFTDSYVVQPTDPNPLVNTATVGGRDLDGELLLMTDTHSLAVGFDPIIQVVKSGPAVADLGATITYIFDVSHAASSDDSAVSAVSVTDDIAGNATYVSGDDGDGLLESGETWVYSADRAVAASDPDPLINIATASGTSRGGDPVSAADSHSLDIDYNPVLSVTKSRPYCGRRRTDRHLLLRRRPRCPQ